MTRMMKSTCAVYAFMLSEEVIRELSQVKPLLDLYGQVDKPKDVRAHQQIDDKEKRQQR